MRIRRDSRRLTTAFVASVILAPGAARADDVVPAEPPATEPPAEVPEASPAEDPRKAADTVIRQRRRDIFRTPGSAHLLEAKDLEATNYDDPQSALAPIPGVYTRTEDGYGLRPNIGIRGASAERSQKVTLMEDGVLFAPAPYSAPAAYYFPMTTRMTGLEVTKGPGAILFGPQTIGGALNLFTRPVPRGVAAGFELAGGTAGDLGDNGSLRSHGFFGLGDDRAGLLLEGVHLETGGFKRLDGAPDANTGFSRSELMLKGRLQTDPDAAVSHRLDLKLGYARERSHETYLGLTETDFRADPWRRYAASALDRMAWGRWQASLTHTLTAGALEVVTTAFSHGLERTWRRLDAFRDGPSLAEVLASPDNALNRYYYQILSGAEDSGEANPADALLLANNDRTFRTGGLQSAVRWRAVTGALRHKLDAGLRLVSDAVARDHTATGWYMQAGRLTPDGRGPETTLRNSADTLALAGHALYGLSGHGVTLTPGARLEVIRGAATDAATGRTPGLTRATLLPGLGLHWALSDSFGLLGGVYRGFSPVAPGQPRDVLPETSINWEAGARYADDSRGTLAETIAFYNDYTNLLGTCTMSSGCRDTAIDRQFNGGAVTIAGVEVTSAWEAPLGRGFTAPLRLAWTFTHTRFASSFASDNPQFDDVETGDALPYVPTHQLHLQAGLARGGHRLTLVYGLTSAMLEQAGRLADARIPKTDVLHLVDAMGAVALGAGWSLELRGENLLGLAAIGSRRPFGARPVRPPMIQLGLRWSL